MQALGLRTPDPNIVQVSTNLLDCEVTPLHVLFEAVRERARGYGVEVAESELVGLMPTAALAATTAQALKLPALHVSRAIEARVLAALFQERPSGNV